MMKLVGWCLGALATGMLLLGCGGGGDAAPAGIRTQFGAVTGVEEASSGTVKYLGIPFAKPPVGALRWKAPVDPEPWSAPLAANKFGNGCIQSGRIYGPGLNNTYDASIATSLNTPVGSEDCLTLNIWRPRESTDNLPVIYFIYGGSNISGYSADPGYDGATLAARAKAVVVTSNYRVGIFGWLRMPQLASGNALDDSGNFGTLDTIQALKFIKKNIAAFGGNPSNITVMGQSAGAVNTYALMVSPQTLGQDLMHRVIPLSGGISATGVALPSLTTLAAAQAYGQNLLAQLVIADKLAADLPAAQAYVAGKSNAEIASYLRGKSAASIIGTAAATVGFPGGSPIPDGAVVPADPIAAIKAGAYYKVPVLAGNTRDEGKLFGGIAGPGLSSLYVKNDAGRFMDMMNFDPDAPNTTLADQIVAAALPVTTPITGYNAATSFLGTLIFTPPRDDVLNALKSQQSNVWYYQFNWDKEPAPWNDVYGAAHAFDLPFVFGNFEKPSLFSRVIAGEANKAGRLALSDAMMSSVSAFVRNGDPNNAKLGVTWPVWPATLTFDASLTQAQIAVQ